MYKGSSLFFLANPPAKEIIAGSLIITFLVGAVSLSHQQYGPWYHDEPHVEQGSTATSTTALALRY